MSLVTFGMSHLTILTWGLGTGFRIVSQQFPVQFGKVEFEDTHIDIDLIDRSVGASFIDEPEKTQFVDNEYRETMEDG